LDFVPTELILNQKIDSFEMNFMKELSLNDVVTIHESDIENKTIFSVTKDEKTSFALEINWK
jgi:hypothetical protein